jgi:hypothetical protein
MEPPLLVSAIVLSTNFCIDRCIGIVISSVRGTNDH